MLASTSLFSQGPGKWGLLLGFNASSFSGSETSIENNKLMPGLTIGFFYEIEIAPRLAFSPEFSFTTKGSRLQSVGDLYLHQVLTYLEMPVRVIWTIKSGKRVSLFLSGGPALDFMLLAFNEVGFPEEIARFDMGVDLGTGIRWQKVQFRVHLTQGLTDLDRSMSLNRIKNRTLSLTAALSF